MTATKRASLITEDIRNAVALLNRLRENAA